MARHLLSARLLPWEVTAATLLWVGNAGVDLFFVLSGFLIGRIVLRELVATGTLKVTRFWGRRWLRTLPAYFATLVFIRGCDLVLEKTLEWDRFWTYLLFLQSYASGLTRFNWSWSLCVEEHFYLAVAPLLLIFWRWRAALVLLPVLLALPVVCRAAGWFFHDPGIETHARYDPCAVGVLLAAINVTRPRLWALLRRFAPFLALAGLAAASRDVACRLNPQWGLEDQGILVWALIFGSWVLLAAARPDWPAGRLPGVRYIAERSYAVYLLHPDALALARKVEGLSFGAFVVLAWVLSFVLAEVLYRLVELPGMRLRERFGASRSREASSAPSAQAP